MAKKIIKKANQNISQDMLLGEVISNYPKAAEVMLSYGLHCIGCMISPYESIAQGCLAHGMDEITTKKLLADLNAVANEEELLGKSGLLVSITSSAAIKLKEYMKEKSKSVGTGIRVWAERSKTDQQRHSYHLDFEDKQRAEDKTFESAGFKIFIKKKEEKLLTGAIIDYRESAGFIVKLAEYPALRAGMNAKRRLHENSRTTALEI
ncbi:hypothetical protein COX84_02835 [Candidatus Micrarchaeota archaeon CG_4_10_14_0_2_um_filter_49_7]|nr:MAG: hypothetical protein AUJ13_03260 [Candidatus Micrarchaeota archaeon CG1_02_49_24]PIZ97838.1 MAG: hypothetical protein COX84_02835 [Candidatus Micrarchaeota archaeon CG_4_10_14_0_2_um_filter_49_7]